MTRIPSPVASGMRGPAPHWAHAEVRRGGPDGSRGPRLLRHLATLPPNWLELLVAVTGGLETHVWTIASRSLQAHCWLVLLLATAMYLLMRAESERGPLRPVPLGVLLLLRG